MFIINLIKKHIRECHSKSVRHICQCGQPIVCSHFSQEEFNKRIPEIEVALKNALNSIRIEFGPEVSDNRKNFTKELIRVIGAELTHIMTFGPSGQETAITVNSQKKNDIEMSG